MATFVAGFGSLGIGVDMLDIYEHHGSDGEELWRVWAGRICVWLSSVTLFLSLWVVCVVLSVVPNARRWALEGPVESVEDSVRRLKLKLNNVINVFTTSLFTFIVERVGNCVLFDITLAISPALFVTGVITLIAIWFEYRAAVRTYTHTPEKRFTLRAFPERPPEVYRELGRMRKMSSVLGSRHLGPSFFRHKPRNGPPIEEQDAACSSAGEPARLENPSKAEAQQHSWLDVTRVTGGRERGYTRRYGSLENGVVTLYCTYEDYILDVPDQSLHLPLADYKLAELGDEDEEGLGQFELVPCGSASSARAHHRHTYRFRPESYKAGTKWISALRNALLELDEPHQAPSSTREAAVRRSDAASSVASTGSCAGPRIPLAVGQPTRPGEAAMH